MTITQNFKVYQGDAIYPQVTVKTPSGSLANLSTVSDIVWTVKNAKGVVILLKKLSTGGGINLPNGGTDGLFQINITTGETSLLSGDYHHWTLIYDSLGQQSTIMVGTFSVLVP